MPVDFSDQLLAIFKVLSSKKQVTEMTCCCIILKYSADTINLRVGDLCNLGRAVCDVKHQGCSLA